MQCSLRSLFFIIAADCLWLMPLYAQDQSPLPPGDSPSPTVWQKLKDAGSAEDHDGADLVIVEDLTVNRIKSSGVAETEQSVLYKVLTGQGCLELSALSWEYLPLTRYVRIDEVSLIREDKLIPIDLNGLLDVPAPQSGIYWGSRMKMLGLPRLRVGDGVLVRIYQKGFSYALLGASDEPPDDERYIPPMAGEYFDIVLFTSGQTTLLKKYSLYLPAEKRLHAEVYNGELFSSVRYSADSTVYSWWRRDIKPRPSERYSPDADDVVPKVVMSTAESWEAKSRWFFDVNLHQFDPTPEIREKVAEILKEAGVSKGDEAAKAKALLHWVANNIRYSGQTMGPGEGFTLHSGEMVFRQRSGVCKDIASMLVTMMRGADMDSYAAMTFAGARIEDLPADQFNHSVCALRKADGSFVMYDPTWAPMSMNIWSRYEMEQHYLIGTPQGQGLTCIAYSPPEGSPLFVESRGELDAEGNLKGTLKIRSEGALDSRLRYLITSAKIEEREAHIAEILSVIDERVVVNQFQHNELYDFNKGMEFAVEYAIPHYALPVAGGLEWESPMMQLVAHERWLLRVGDYEWPEDRKNDLFVWFTQLYDGRERIMLPKGLTLVKTPETDTVDETYVFSSGDCKQDKREVVVHQKVEVRRRQIPLTGYPGFRKAVNGAQDFAKTVFRAEKGGDR